MNKVALVKIAGFLVVPILVMLVVIYFLYPLINSDKYDLIVRTKGTMIDSVLIDSLARMDSIATADSLAQLAEENLDVDQKLARVEEKWVSKVDSLSKMIYLLSAKLENLDEIPSSANSSSASNQTNTEEDEAFSEKVKSLLALDEDEMAPILSKMSKKQLVMIYKEAGNMQREKILRALSSDRAAELITEIML